MGELGTHLAIERARVGNSPPKVIRAAFLPDDDGLQPTLRSGFQPRLTPSVSGTELVPRLTVKSLHQLSVIVNVRTRRRSVEVGL
jgi:hypothetical protein